MRLLYLSVSRSPEMQQVRRLERFSLHRRLRFSLYHTASVRILMNCCNRIQYVALTIALSDSGERINRDKNYGCTQYDVVPRASRSSTPTVKATVVWNSWSRRYAPHLRENVLPVRIIRRQKASPEDTCADLQVCCVVRGAHQIPGITFSQETLLEQLTVTGASVSCFGERYWHLPKFRRKQQN